MGRASRLRLALTAVLLASLFYGSTCAVSTSSGCTDVDCFEGCDCSGGCGCFESCGFCLHVSESADSTDDSQLPVRNAEELRLESYALTVEIGADGSVSRTYHTILGPSFAGPHGDRTSPERSDSTAEDRNDLVRVSAGILRANADVFGRTSELWNVSIDRFEHVTRVSFERETTDHEVSIAFLFDGDGHLVEILEHRAPRERG